MGMLCATSVVWLISTLCTPKNCYWPLIWEKKKRTTKCYPMLWFPMHSARSAAEQITIHQKLLLYWTKVKWRKWLIIILTTTTKHTHSNVSVHYKDFIILQWSKLHQWKKDSSCSTKKSIHKLWLELCQINGSRLNWGHKIGSQELRGQGCNEGRPLQVLHKRNVFTLPDSKQLLVDLHHPV